VCLHWPLLVEMLLKLWKHLLHVHLLYQTHLSLAALCYLHAAHKARRRR
jgi:hypothetical protein